MIRVGLRPISVMSAKHTRSASAPSSARSMSILLGATATNVGSAAVSPSSMKPSVPRRNSSRSAYSSASCRNAGWAGGAGLAVVMPLPRTFGSRPAGTSTPGGAQVPLRVAAARSCVNAPAMVASHSCALSHPSCGHRMRPLAQPGGDTEVPVTLCDKT
jgi:hypothetical protein